MRFLLITITVLLLSSCISNKNTSYRVLNKNGKVVYFERKKPILNNSIVSNKQELTNIQNINKKVKNTKEIKKINNDKIDNNLILGSSAYTLKSVVDNVVKEEDISYVAKKIDKTKKTKTIQDFVIPEYYFNDNINKTKIDNRTKEEKIQQIELENKENEKEYGLFARIFGGNRNKITENIVSKEDKEQLKKIELENQKNEKEYGLFARIFGGNRNKTINNIKEETDTIETKESSIKEELKVGSIVINDKQQLGKSKNDKYTNKQNKANVVYKLASEDTNIELKDTKKYEQIENKEITNNKEELKYITQQQDKKQKRGLFGGLFKKDNSTKKNENNNITNKQQNNFVETKNINNKQTITENNISTPVSIQAQSEVNNNLTNSNYLQKNKYYIQLGSFANEVKAKKLLSNFKNIGDSGKVVPVNIKDRVVYRAVIGTFNTKIIAEREMEKVLNKGHFDCYVFKKK